MRTTHPLREILEAALQTEELVHDSEWPAGEVLLVPEPARGSPRPEPSFLRPVQVRPR